MVVYISFLKTKSCSSWVSCLHLSFQGKWNDAPVTMTLATHLRCFVLQFCAVTKHAGIDSQWLASCLSGQQLMSVVSVEQAMEPTPNTCLISAPGHITTHPAPSNNSCGCNKRSQFCARPWTWKLQKALGLSVLIIFGFGMKAKVKWLYTSLLINLKQTQKCHRNKRGENRSNDGFIGDKPFVYQINPSMFVYITRNKNKCVLRLCGGSRTDSQLCSSFGGVLIFQRRICHPAMPNVNQTVGLSSSWTARVGFVFAQSSLAYKCASLIRPESIAGLLKLSF